MPQLVPLQMQTPKKHSPPLVHALGFGQAHSQPAVSLNVQMKPGLHLVPQAPQLPVVPRSASQPLAAKPSQSAELVGQLETLHAPAVQAELLGQVSLQVAQF